MKTINNIFGHFWVIISFCVLFLIVSAGSSFAESWIKITEPEDGAVVYPGQEITIAIEAVDGFEIKKGMLAISGILGIAEFNTLPLTFPYEVPIETAGTIGISVAAKDASGNWVKDEITLIVEQTADLQFLEVNPVKLSFDIDWNGNVEDYSPRINVHGMYSDGIKRKITHAGTTYVSSNPLVVSIEDNKVQAHKVGEAVVTVSNSGVSVDIPVTFEEPRGIRPEETIPPTTEINIQPLTNEAGWHNSDITITITAQDNEGGSGIRAIDYSILGTEDMQNQYIENAVVDIFFDREGVYELVYASI